MKSTGVSPRRVGVFRRIGKCLLVLLALCVLWFAVSAVVCSFWITTTRYSVSLPGLSAPVRAVAVSDLHGKSFGKDNSRLIAKIAAPDPDLIFLVGDMLPADADSADEAELLGLISALNSLAPVYFSVGNHESEYISQNPDFLSRVASTGAVVVNDSFVDVTVSGQTLRIGGTFGHAFYFGRSEEEFTSSPEYIFLSDLQNTDLPRICLAHMPDTFIFNWAYDMWDVDLVISGHTHGGLIRLPFVGGLYAPMQGFFPEYDRGYFLLGGHMPMIITSGLAGHKYIPRVNNLPEIAVIDLIPE